MKEFKIPFLKKSIFIGKTYLIVENTKRKSYDEIPDSLESYLKLLKKEYSDGIWTNDINEIINDIETAVLFDKLLKK